jgi:4-amino-4-deoxy-L-arabinose transferase-like glycosyltransferase
MKLIGDEKKIQALFRELRLEDQQVVPGFERVWNCARASRSERRRVTSTSLVALTSALVVATVCMLTLWSTDRSSEIPKQEVAGMIPVAIPIAANSLETSGHRKLAPRKKTQLAAKQIIRNAVALSTWKSPTAILMESPAGSEINSLPQLNQAAKELQLFLPNNR